MSKLPINVRKFRIKLWDYVAFFGCLFQLAYGSCLFAMNLMLYWPRVYIGRKLGSIGA